MITQGKRTGNMLLELTVSYVISVIIRAYRLNTRSNSTAINRTSSVGPVVNFHHSGMIRQNKKPTRRNIQRYFAASAYSLTSPPVSTELLFIQFSDAVERRLSQSEPLSNGHPMRMLWNSNGFIFLFHD
jgi:hypothetical protein